jgi:hypothetical protein
MVCLLCHGCLSEVAILGSFTSLCIRSKLVTPFYTLASRKWFAERP